MLTVEPNLPVVPNGGSGIHRNPAERTANAVGFAPGEFGFSELLAASDVFLGNDLQCLAVKAQQLTSTLGIRVKIEGRQKLSSLPNAAMTEFIHKIPHAINGRGLKPQPLCVFVPNANFEGFGELSHTVYNHSVSAKTRPLPRSRYPSPPKCYGKSLALGLGQLDGVFRDYVDKKLRLRLYKMNYGNDLVYCVLSCA